MKTDQRGQTIVIVALMLVAAVIFLAVITDGAHLMLKQQKLIRAADAAGKAGLIAVGDQLVLQAGEAQSAVTRTAEASASGGTALDWTSTPAPQANVFSWIDEDHRKTLVAPPMQTLVAAQVLVSAEENGLGMDNPSVGSIIIQYPLDYKLDDPAIRIGIQIRQVVVVLFGNLLNLENLEVTGYAEQEIPQR
jgi:hypothetical protein